MDTTGRETRRRRTITQAIAKRYAFHVTQSMVEILKKKTKQCNTKTFNVAYSREKEKMISLFSIKYIHKESV